MLFSYSHALTNNHILILSKRENSHKSCSKDHNLHKYNMASKIAMLLGVNYSKFSGVLCNWQSNIVNAVSIGH